MLLKHTLYYFLSRGVPGIVSFLAIAVYTRLLEPGEFGIYSLVLTLVSFCNVVFYQWLRMVLGRNYPAHRDSPDEFLAGVGTLFLLTTAVAGVAVLVAALLTEDATMRQFAAIALAMLVAHAAFDLVLALARAMLKPGLYGLLLGSKSVLALAAGALLALSGLGAAAPIWGLTVGYALAIVLFGRKLVAGMRPGQVARADLSAYLRYGMPLTAAFALSWVISGSDRVILTWLLDEAATGIYASGYDLGFQSLTLVLVVVNTAAYPLVVNALERKGEDAARRQLRQNGEAILSLALAGAACLVIIGSPLIELVLAVEYRDGAKSIFLLVVVSSALAGIKSYYFDIAFQLARATHWQVVSVGVAAVVNVVLNLLLIPRFGILGAAWATVAAYAAALIISVLTGRRQFGLMPALSSLLKSAIPISALAALGCWAMLGIAGDSTVLALVFGLVGAAIGYLAGALLFNTFGIRSAIWSRLGVRMKS